MAEQAPTDLSNLFTCLSCSVAFLSAEDQRHHYRSDHHRYNMKRRVAGLPPVGASLFNQKVLDKKSETAVESSFKGCFCQTCRKTYTTANAYRSHLNSKKHKDAELKALNNTKPLDRPTPANGDLLAKEDDPEGDEEEEATVEEARLSPTDCLFCLSTLSSISETLSHMSSFHSFFIPDAEYLTDLPGLLAHLAEKVSAFHTCIFCNGKGRDFRSLEAVRKHMIDKGHCKIAYDTETQRLDISDFYDFTTSYPDGHASKETKRRVVPTPAVSDEWEDVDSEDDDDGEVDEIVDASATPSDSEDEDHDAADSQLTYGDSPYELVLPSGARIGHRSMRRYYAQSFLNPLTAKHQDPNSGAALVRKLIGDKNSTLVPTRGGFGAFGNGTNVVKARNRGEAREAGRHVREFRDQSRREQFKTQVGYRHNHQKHFRDPLLQ